MKLFVVIFIICLTKCIANTNASSFGRGKSCVENSDCKRGLACDIRKHPATFTCLVTFGGSCSRNIDCVNGLTCYNGKCSCDHTSFYDDERNDCISKQQFGQSCQDTDQCQNRLVCASHGKMKNTCLFGINDVCSQDSDCANHLKCLSGKCGCVKGFEEFNAHTQTCEMVRYKNEKTHCYTNSDCRHQNLACDRSPNGNKTNGCARIIGEFCQDTNDCTNGLICVFNGCQCDPKNQYYDYTEHDCIYKKSLHESCHLTYQCGDRLVCDLRRNFICLKSFGTQCRNTSDCANHMECVNNLCGCPLNQYYNPELNDCFPQQDFGHPCSKNNECLSNLACDKNPSQDNTKTCSYLLGARCSANSDCVNSVKCIRGYCACPPGKHFNQETNECELFKHVGDSGSGTASGEILADANTKMNISYDDLEKMIDTSNNYTFTSSNNGSNKTFYYEDLN